MQNKKRRVEGGAKSTKKSLEKKSTESGSLSGYHTQLFAMPTAVTALLHKKHIRKQISVLAHIIGFLLDFMMFTTSDGEKCHATGYSDYPVLVLLGPVLYSSYHDCALTPIAI